MPVSDGTSALAVVRDMFSRFDDGTPTLYGSDGFLEFIADECDWVEFSGDTRFAGRRGDKAALSRAVGQSKSELYDRHATIQEMVADTERVAVFWTWSAVPVDGSPKLTASVVSLFTVSDGSITRWHDRIAVGATPEG